jgi:hypothetical protein
MCLPLTTQTWLTLLPVRMADGAASSVHAMTVLQFLHASCCNALIFLSDCLLLRCTNFLIRLFLLVRRVEQLWFHLEHPQGLAREKLSTKESRIQNSLSRAAT